MKGESVIVFAIRRDGGAPSPNLKQELIDHMRRVWGPIPTLE